MGDSGGAATFDENYAYCVDIVNALCVVFVADAIPPRAPAEIRFPLQILTGFH